MTVSSFIAGMWGEEGQINWLLAFSWYKLSVLYRPLKISVDLYIKQYLESSSGKHFPSTLITQDKNVILIYIYMSWVRFDTLTVTAEEKDKTHRMRKVSRQWMAYPEWDKWLATSSCFPSESLCFRSGWCFRNWATYVIMDFSSGLSTSTSEEGTKSI